MAESTQAPDRLALTDEEVQAGLRAGTLIMDGRRRRPNYFDGRFLTAADLTADQAYVLSRLSDLARSQGEGVSEGLLVLQPDGQESGGEANTRLRVTQGWGLTGSGELVGLGEDQLVDLQAVARVQALNQRFGLAELPAEPQRSLSGVFVLGLRPVEFSDGPIASYPSGVAGERRIEDGSIVEATAITLIPYGDAGAGDGEEQRRRLTRQIFLVGEGRIGSPSVLPLAVVALSRGGVDWVDPWLVRRELGAGPERGWPLLGAARPRRQAHLQHYSQQLREILRRRQDQGRGAQFAAAEHFALLPPVGPLPSAAILPPAPAGTAAAGAELFQQVFFPPEMETGLAIVPEDELSAVIEEALNLPPIDLTLSPVEREGIAVLILLPVARASLAALLNRLGVSPLQPALQPMETPSPGLAARRRPAEILSGLRRPAPRSMAPDLTWSTGTAQGGSVPLANGQAAIWRQELERQPNLWFVRRRQYPGYQSPTLLPTPQTEPN
jgi:hypothetical protein